MICKRRKRLNCLHPTPLRSSSPTGIGEHQPKPPTARHAHDDPCRVRVSRWRHTAAHRSTPPPPTHTTVHSGENSQPVGRRCPPLKTHTPRGRETHTHTPYKIGACVCLSPRTRTTDTHGQKARVCESQPPPWLAGTNPPKLTPSPFHPTLAPLLPNHSLLPLGITFFLHAIPARSLRFLLLLSHRAAYNTARASPGKRMGSMARTKPRTDHK